MTPIPRGLRGEAGAVEHDGHGLLLAHESSWVNHIRNPALTRDEIETRLLAAYGTDRMIWTRDVQGLDIIDHHILSRALVTAVVAIIAIVGVKIQLDAADNLEQAQSARDAYRARLHATGGRSRPD